MVELDGKGQLSLVAFYEKKPEEHGIWKYLEKVQEIISDNLNEGPGKEEHCFIPYERSRIHGTIVGLEAAWFKETLISKNVLNLLKEIRNVDLNALVEFVDDLEISGFLPLKIKVGGFKNTDEYIFTSRSASPYIRSFSIQGDIIVAMGWPVSQNGDYEPNLDTLRRRLSRYGYLHKYHAFPDSYDNDFFFVLGNLESEKKLKEIDLKKLQETILVEMASWQIDPLPLAREDISIVAYKDTKFEDAKRISLDDAKKYMDTLIAFYPDYETVQRVDKKNWLCQ